MLELPKFSFEAMRPVAGFGDDLTVSRGYDYIDLMVKLTPPDGPRGGWCRSARLTLEGASRLRAALGVLLKQPAALPETPSGALVDVHADFHLDGAPTWGRVSAFAIGSGGRCVIHVTTVTDDDNCKDAGVVVSVEQARSFALGLLAVTGV